eukprot:COSAG02_NODE_6550_length_3501_cov_4.747795_2_plen_162_part_00
MVQTTATRKEPGGTWVLRRMLFKTGIMPIFNAPDYARLISCQPTRRHIAQTHQRELDGRLVVFTLNLRGSIPLSLRIAPRNSGSKHPLRYGGGCCCRSAGWSGRLIPPSDPCGETTGRPRRLAECARRDDWRTSLMCLRDVTTRWLARDDAKCTPRPTPPS